MAIVKWDSFSLQPWVRFPRWFEEWDWPEPSRGLRLQETDKEIVAEVVVAGVPVEKVKVSIEGGILIIKAEAEEKEEKKRKNDSRPTSTTTPPLFPADSGTKPRPKSKMGS